MANKVFISFFLICTIIFSLASTAFATEPTTTTQNAVIETTLDRANALKEMGLFAGTDKGYELEALPTRTQAIVFLLRMLGEEKTAQNSDYTCPFTDVPGWAYKYVAYAYNKGYTSGTGKTTFGANDLTTPAQFVTFMLRALGYSDKNGDFVWNESIQKAESLGIIPLGKYTANGPFNRGDCVDIIYSVLGAKKKGSDVTLAESLVANGAIDAAIAEKYGFVNQTASHEALVDLSSVTFTNNLRLSYFTAKGNEKSAFIHFGISPSDRGLKATNIYLSIDGTNYEKLKISRVRDDSVTPYVIEIGQNNYEIINLQFSTEYTVCVENNLNEFLTPITIKTASAQAASISGFGSPSGSKSSDGIYTSVSVGANPMLDGDWSYQFFRWTPGSDPVAIPGASGKANGHAVVSYEPTAEDLNCYIFWRVSNDDGIIIENNGWYIDYVAGMPVQ